MPNCRLKTSTMPPTWLKGPSTAHAESAGKVQEDCGTHFMAQAAWPSGATANCATPTTMV